MMQNVRAKIIYNVISSTQKKTEPSMQTDEVPKTEKEKGKCHVCGRAGHKMKQCWFHDATKTLEENKKIAQEKMKEKKEERKGPTGSPKVLLLLTLTLTKVCPARAPMHSCLQRWSKQG
jgi:hypothetical protein